MKRTLSLTRETLCELTAGQLTSVVGGQQAVPTTPVKDCYNDLIDTLQATRCFCP
jgi:hypothetical protein